MSEATSRRVRRHHADHLRHTDADLDAAVDRALADIQAKLHAKAAMARAYSRGDPAGAEARARAHQSDADTVRIMRARASDAG